jgi:hypothetical protein
MCARTPSVRVAQRPTADSPTLAAGSRASRNQIRFVFAALFQVIFDSLFSVFFLAESVYFVSRVQFSALNTALQGVFLLCRGDAWSRALYSRPLV